MGARTQSQRWAVPASLAAILWLPVAWTSAVVVWNSLPYFSALTTQDFLLERPEVTSGTAWRIALVVHVAAGIVCLIAALGQFSSTVLQRVTRFHRIAGRVYGVSALVLLVPTGLLLSFSAKGGLSGQLAFALLAIWTGTTTWLGIRAAWQGRIPEHRAWMIRSYAMIATALSFRLIYLTLHAWDVPAYYVRSIWLSGILNLLVAEWFVTRPRQRSRLGNTHSLQRKALQ